MSSSLSLKQSFASQSGLLDSFVSLNIRRQTDRYPWKVSMRRFPHQRFYLNLRLSASVKSKNIQPAIIQVNAAKKRLPSQVFVLNLSQFKEAVAATPARASKPCSCRPRPMQLSETFCALCGCVWSACGSESLGSWQIAHSILSNYHNNGMFSSLRNSLPIWMVEWIAFMLTRNLEYVRLKLTR